MVIHDLHVVGVTTAPHETDSPSVVDANAVLTFAVPVERFEAVARWSGQVAQVGGDIQLSQPALRHALETSKSWHALAGVKPLRFPRPEGLDHTCIL